MSDIEKLMTNLDKKAKETLIEIALSMAEYQASNTTGSTVWEIHFSQGSVGDASVQTKKSLFPKRRKVRSRGI